MSELGGRVGKHEGRHLQAQWVDHGKLPEQVRVRKWFWKCGGVVSAFHKVIWIVWKSYIEETMVFLVM